MNVQTLLIIAVGFLAGMIPAIHIIYELASQTPARAAHFAGISSWDESTQWTAEANALLATPSHDGA